MWTGRDCNLEAQSGFSEALRLGWEDLGWVVLIYDRLSTQTASKGR